MAFATVAGLKLVTFDRAPRSPCSEVFVTFLDRKIRQPVSFHDRTIALLLSIKNHPDRLPAQGRSRDRNPRHPRVRLGRPHTQTGPGERSTETVAGPPHTTRIDFLSTGPPSRVPDCSVSRKQAVANSPSATTKRHPNWSTARRSGRYPALLWAIVGPTGFHIHRERKSRAHHAQ